MGRVVKIVILHGWGHNKTMWSGLKNKLGPNALTMDMPGFGKQPLVSNKWGVPEYARWVESQTQQFNSIILVGHSFGGRVAAEIASKNPSWLKGLVLSGAPCLYRPTAKTKVKIGIFKVAKHFIPTRFGENMLPAELKSAKSKGLEKIFRNVVTFDQKSQLKKILVPTLLIWGENDDQVPTSDAKKMSNLIKKSTLKIIENAGHNAFLDKPELFYGYIKNYISNL